LSEESASRTESKACPERSRRGPLHRLDLQEPACIFHPMLSSRWKKHSKSSINKKAHSSWLAAKELPGLPVEARSSPRSTGPAAAPPTPRQTSRSKARPRCRGTSPPAAPQRGAARRDDARL